jgi:lysophospholipase L1-like esterase
VAHQAYAALGDSMSIDRYPALDAAGRGWPVAPTAAVGAASLLARNEDAMWPEFRGRDLVHLRPGVEVHLLASDGATTGTVLDEQLDALRRIDRGAEALVTLTVGGNDLLGLIGASDAVGEAGVRAVLAALETIVRSVRERLPRARLLMANVYDPTDGTGDLEGARLRPREMQWLAEHNEGVARLCRATGARLVDVHAHFLGHGRSAPGRERWYWAGSLIEPGLVGASELRRLWLDALL